LHRHDETTTGVAIAKSAPQRGDVNAQGLLANKYAWPYLLDQFILGHDVARTASQRNQKLQRARTKAD